MKHLSLFIVVMLSSVCFAQNGNTNNELVSIVNISDVVVNNKTCYFLNDITYPANNHKMEKQLTKFLYGHSWKMESVVENHAQDVVYNQLKATYNTNFIFCMAYQKNAFYSFISLQTPFIHSTTDYTGSLKCGVYDLKNNKMLTVKDIFIPDFLNQHKEISKNDIFFIMSDWTIILINNSNRFSYIASALGSEDDYKIKKYDLWDLKESLMPDFLSIIDWNTVPIYVETHSYDDAKAQKVAETIKSKIYLTEN